MRRRSESISHLDVPCPTIPSALNVLTCVLLFMLFGNWGLSVPAGFAMFRSYMTVSTYMLKLFACCCCCQLVRRSRVGTCKEDHTDRRSSTVGQPSTCISPRAFSFYVTQAKPAKAPFPPSHHHVTLSDHLREVRSKQILSLHPLDKDQREM